MENPKAPNYRRLAILAVLFIAISTVLLFWARDVIREMIVLPLSYLFFVIGVLIDYTPQIFFWGVVLLIGARIAFLSIAQKKKKDDREITSFYRPVDEKPITSGRVLFWTNKVHLLRSGRGVYYTHTFHDALSKTLFQLLAYRYRMPAPQIEEGLRDGTLDLPPEIREYALEGLDADEGPTGQFWDIVWDWISSALRSGFFRLKFAFQKTAGETNSMGSQAQSSDEQARSITAAQRMDPRLARVDSQVRRVLKFMEEELEVPHDDTGR